MEKTSMHGEDLQPAIFGIRRAVQGMTLDSNAASAITQLEQTVFQLQV